MSTTRTNDKLTIDMVELLDNFGQSAPQNDAQINSFKGRPVSTPALYVYGTTRFNGQILSDINSTRRILMSDGSAGEPSLTYIDDSTTGIFQPAAGEMEIVSSGSPVVNFTGSSVQFFVPISAPPGLPFIINAPILQNAQGGIGGATTQYSLGVITTNATPTNLLNIPSDSPTSNRVYVFDVSIGCANMNTLSDVASYQFIFRARKLGTVFTTVGPLQLTQAIDTGLAGAGISLSGGGSVSLQVVGLAGTTIRWTGRVVVTTQDF